ncbi:MAG: hypothetical protein U9R60_04170 [Bacteroidota bacterium]|nr:hypothetical protein [Bacteroidota bacterium]
MKRNILICLLALLPLFLSAQVQKKTKQTTTNKNVQQKQVLTTTKVKADMKQVQPAEEKDPVDPVAEAMQRAYNWLAPFKSYHLLTVDQIPTIKNLDLATGSPVINGVSRTYYMCDDSLVHLRAFTGLEIISVPPWMTNAGLVHIATLQNLKGLYLSKSLVNDQGIASLPTMSTVENVILSSTGVTNSSMQILNQKFPSMKILNVGSTSVNDLGLTYIDPNTNLEVLMLNRGNFTDACIPTIIQFTGLQTIGVEFTQISAAGKQQLRAAFPNATIIPSGD